MAMYLTTVHEFYPDDEPFESGIEEEIDPVQTECRVGVHHCLDCGHEEFWLEDPRSPLEGEVKRLRTACKSALYTIAALESGKLTDFAAHYTMVASTCSSLRAVLGLEPKGDGDG